MQFIWYPSLKAETEKQFNVILENIDSQTINGVEFIKISQLKSPSSKITGEHLIGKYNLKNL